MYRTNSWSADQGVSESSWKPSECQIDHRSCGSTQSLVLLTSNHTSSLPTRSRWPCLGAIRWTFSFLFALCEKLKAVTDWRWWMIHFELQFVRPEEEAVFGNSRHERPESFRREAFSLVRFDLVQPSCHQLAWPSSGKRFKISPCHLCVARFSLLTLDMNMSDFLLAHAVVQCRVHFWMDSTFEKRMK
jgi:hypothetical protein